MKYYFKIREVNTMAKIKEINEKEIVFDDGSIISYEHDSDCCEENFADFSQIDDITRQFDFDTKNMIFEKVPGCGFRFGNKNFRFLVPCYSWQNGYYSADLTILYNGNIVLNVECEIE